MNTEANTPTMPDPAQSLTPSSQTNKTPKTRIMPEQSPTALIHQDQDPEFFLNNVVPYVADKIVGEWRQARNAPGMPKARESSILQYEKNSSMLEAKYARELGIDPSDISPVETIRRFFYHALDISDASWKIYRAGLLHSLNNRLTIMENKGLPQPTLLRALASLIVFSKKPNRVANVEESRDGKQRSRVKSIKSRYYNQLIDHLANGFSARNLNARRAQSFAIATLSTGLRPSEWRLAKLRPARQDEMPDGNSCEGWMAIEVNTAKRKNEEEVWIRTLLIEPGPNQIHIRQHHATLMESVRTAQDRLHPDKLYIRRCSTAMSNACKQLWPGREHLWITLYSLRSQARANFASVHGTYLAAAMMGHSPRLGQDCYAGSQRANLNRGAKIKASLQVPMPGPDCMQKAAEFQARDNARAMVDPGEMLSEGNEQSGEGA